MTRPSSGTRRTSRAFIAALLLLVLVFASVLPVSLALSTTAADGRRIYTARNIPPLPQSPRKRAKSQNKPEYIAHPASDLVCRPFGECEACPSDELDQPFCLPFGNRRLLHCLPASQAHDAGEGGDTRQPAGEVPAWESCGRVIRKERQDFWEFVTANMLFLIVALAILWGRSSALASAQYRQLAARIGIPSGNWQAGA